MAKDRRISVEDGQMRHGRKSRSVLVDGYKPHLLHDLGTGLIRAVGITPANVPEASVTGAISEDLCQQEVCLKELHIDRAYLSTIWCGNAAMIWRCIAKPGRYARANAFPSKPLP